eukprot:4244453-Lingulodinium_polyedra.AAC.1
MAIVDKDCNLAGPVNADATSKMVLAEGSCPPAGATARTGSSAPTGRAMPASAPEAGGLSLLR